MASRILLKKVSRYVLLGGSISGTGLAYYRYQQCIERERQLPSHSLLEDGSKNSKPDVVVIGGGVVGITTAYTLAKQSGLSVIVLEPRAEPGKECSSCAAGGMQRSNPVVDRSQWISVLKCLSPFNNDSFRFFNISWWDTLTDPFFIRWVITFTKTSLFPNKDQEDKQLEMLKFTKYAVEEMKTQLMENRWDNMAKKSGYNTNGSLSVSYDPLPTDTTTSTESTSEKNNDKDKNKSKSSNPTQSKMSYEPYRTIIGTDEIIQLEPSLIHQKVKPTSAKYEYESTSASSERFTEELANRCINDPKLNVSILYNTKVEAMSTTITSDGNKQIKRISELKTNRGVLSIPNNTSIVIAAGSWTPHILSLIDLYVPVYPLKGYAMSVSAKQALLENKSLKQNELPNRIVADKYMYTTRLGDDEIRITSIGEFNGWITKPTIHVNNEFRNEAIRQFPQLKSLIENTTTKCGHRPFVNDGILLLGQDTNYNDLYISVGPGSNGWKLALGSAIIIDKLILGQQTAEQIQKELGFNISVFSPNNRVLYSPIFTKLCRARWNI